MLGILIPRGSRDLYAELPKEMVTRTFQLLNEKMLNLGGYT